MNVDPEFRDLIPPLTPAERDALEQSIAREGCRDPIVVWRDTIVDGHNRYEICTRLRIPYQTRELRGVPDRESALRWAWEHQRGRRNLTPDQQAMLGVQFGATTDSRVLAVHAIPELRDRVARGEISLRMAWNDGVRAGKIVGKKPAPRRKPSGDPVAVQRAKLAATEAKRTAKALTDRVRKLEDLLAVHAEVAARKPEPVAPLVFARDSRREATAEILLSDVHCETRVLPGDTEQGNAYSLAICEHRLRRFFAGSVWLTRAYETNFRVPTMILWLGGDFITNHLHPENVETAALGPGAAIGWIQDRLVSGIQSLLDSLTLDRLVIPCSVGNHGRTNKFMTAATVTDHSWEYVMYQAIARHFADNPRVEVFAPPADHVYLDVYDWRVHYHHGHTVRYAGGVGGVMIPLNKRVDAWRADLPDDARACRYHRIGHWHQLIQGDITVNGSLIGYDAYAKSIGARPEPPQQSYSLFDSRRGLCASNRLWVGDREEEAKIWARERVHREALGLKR